ncbi:MAG TPA: hypothetical protein VIS31_09125 [Woeseiaceae bacterium]
MAKRSFAAVLVMLAAMPLDGQAGQPPWRITDCSRLADIVYDEVTAYLIGAPGELHDTGPAQAVPQVVVCEETARTVSAAFSRSVSVVGGVVDWGWPSGDGGDVCLSGFIDQCYPDRGARVYPFPDPGVGSTWMAVRRTVLGAMPWGSAADRAEFSAGALRGALRVALHGSGR